MCFLWAKTQRNRQQQHHIKYGDTSHVHAGDLIRLAGSVRVKSYKP